MSFTKIYFPVCYRLVQFASFVFAALVLVFATAAKSSSSTLHSSGNGKIIYSSMLTGSSVANESSIVYAGVLDKEPLIINAAFAGNASIVSASDGEAATEKSQIFTAHAGPDWNGVVRDVGMVFGVQVAAVGVTYVLPESFSSWTPEQKKNGLNKYRRNFVDPVLDKDKFYVNYLLHPYWGATYYIRGRERGLDQTSSLILSTMLSAMYEFGVECVAERPSIQDLIITPGLGTLLGAYVFEPLREVIKNKQELKWYDHSALVLTDPLGVLSLGVEKVFGIKSTITVNYNPQIQNRSAGTAVASRGNRLDLVMQFPLE